MVAGSVPEAGFLRAGLGMRGTGVAKAEEKS